MEKDYADYAWNIRQAVLWYRLIGKDKRAEEFHTTHLQIANEINDRFK